MKKFLLLFLLIGFNKSQAQNIIVTSDYYIINADDKLKIINKLDNKILFTTDVSTSSVTESIFISSDKSKIWYLNSFDYYFIDTKTWKAEKKISGFNVFEFNPSSNKNYFVYTVSGDEMTSEIYNANTGELFKTISYAANSFIADVMFDEDSKKLYQISSTFSSESESKADSGIPESVLELETAMKNDGKKVELIVYDLTGDKITYKEEIYYSPQFHYSFESIKGQLYIITAMGTAKIKTDNTLQLLPVMTGGNLRAYAVNAKEMIGFTFFELFKFDFASQTYTSLEEYHEGILSSNAIFSANGVEYYFLGADEILIFKSTDLLTPTNTITIPSE